MTLPDKDDSRTEHIRDRVRFAKAFLGLIWNEKKVELRINKCNPKITRQGFSVSLIIINTFKLSVVIKALRSIIEIKVLIKIQIDRLFHDY